MVYLLRTFDVGQGAHMPFCPECGAEYRAEIRHCADCDVDLVDSPPESTAGDAEQSGLEVVELASFPNSAEAEMIKELLEANAVRTVLRGEADPIGVASGATPTTLLVEERDLERARELYDAYFAGEGVQEADPSTDVS
jgi:hypothetical protein